MLGSVFSLLLLALALSLDSFGVGITYGLRKLRIPLLSILIISLCSGVVIGISMQAGVLLAEWVSPDAASVVGAVILVVMGCWSFIQLLIQKEKEKEHPPGPPELRVAAAVSRTAEGAGGRRSQTVRVRSEAAGKLRLAADRGTRTLPGLSPSRFLQPDAPPSRALPPKERPSRTQPSRAAAGAWGLSAPASPLPPSGSLPSPALSAGADSARLDAAEPKRVYSLELRRIGVVIQILRTPSSADLDASGSISPLEAVVLGAALSLDAFGAGLGAALLGFHPGATSLLIALFSGSFLVLGMKTGFRFAGSVWMKNAAALPALLLIIMGIMKLL
ncbi:manganese efflux pump [Paenibacillus sp. CN-4]|uniref:manganese efflux pump n=1 Tax=Paenibacillus nanchangensis TaxID=3348343 RepID=UPI00397BD7C0